MAVKRRKIVLLVVLLAWAVLLAFGLRFYNGYFFLFDLPDRSGWVGEGAEKQYLDRHAGVVKDTLLKVDSVTYYFDKDGYVYKGVIELDGFVYSFNEWTGAMQYGWIVRDSGRYYFDDAGHMVIDQEYAIGGRDFLFDATGAEVTGQVSRNGALYYYDEMTGKVLEGERQVDGAWFYYTADGTRFGTGWQTLPDGRAAYYDGDNGMLFGEQTIDGKPYLLNISRGGRMTGTVYFDGRVYQISDDGVVQSKKRLPQWKGIDVSVHQGEIDWKAVAESGVQFAFVRAGYIASEERPVFKPDRLYAENVLMAQENGISVGAYIYIYNYTQDGLTEGIGSFDAYTNENRIKLDLPVFLDIEDKLYFKPGSDDLGGYDYRTAFTRDGMDQLRSLGYKAGFYTFQTWANNEFDAERLFNEGYPFWLANWYGNDKELDPATLSWNKTAQPSVWQYRATGQTPGIQGETDMDYLYWDNMR